MSARPHSKYDGLSQALHWITAVAVLAAFILGPGGFGRLMRQGIDPATRSSIVWHETLGVLIFCLAVVRLIWMLLRPTPPEEEMSGWMRFASKTMQLALWALLIVLPVSAIMTLGGEGHPLTLLGGFRVDKMPVIANLGLAHAVDWGDVHGFLGDTIMWLAGLHALAAIYHHALLKDGVLTAMLPWGK